MIIASAVRVVAIACAGVLAGIYFGYGTGPQYALHHHAAGGPAYALVALGTRNTARAYLAAGALVLQAIALNLRTVSARR